jgi:hypothetical protein
MPLRLVLAAAATVVLAVAVSLPTESAQLISALTAPRHPSYDPKSYVGMYHASADSCPGLSWTVLAAVGDVETHHGRLARRSAAGALGPMQFLPTTWQAYATDGDHDGKVDVHNPPDAIATAARYLCANGAGSHETLATAIWNYNHSWAYVARVLAVSSQLAEADRPA